MTPLTLRLLGHGVLIAGTTVVRTHSARTFALLAYLALAPGVRHPRAALIDLLWPDLPEASGRQGLRQALYSLRTVADGGVSSCLQVDAKWVVFQPGAAIDIDVHRFLAAVRSDLEADWLAAAAIQDGPLLDGLPAVPGGQFDAWLHAERDRLGALALQNLGRLVTAHMARADWVAAARHARAMCAREPTNELASQYLMRILAAQGRVQDIDHEWGRLCGQLSQAFGVAPSAESVALHGALRLQGGAVPAQPLVVAPTPAGKPPGIIRPVASQDADAMVWAGQAAERVFAFDQAAEHYDRALRVMARHGAAPAQRVDVLMRREAVLDRLGRRSDQSVVIGKAMAILQNLDDPARLATVCLREAGVCVYQRRHGQAQAVAERALQILRDLGDGPGEAEALRELGFIHWHADQHAEALQRTREALALHRRIGDATGEATALHNLAEIHRGLGSPGQAAPWFAQAMQLHWAAGNPVGEILSLFGWAQALHQAGDLPASAEKLQAALTLCEQRGERVMHSRVLHALSLQHAAQGALGPALDCMRRAVEIDRAIGYAHALGHDLCDLANLHLQNGERAQARVALREALVWFGINDDSDALDATRAQLAALDTQGLAAVLPAGRRHGVKSHLALGEGKVYCAFESPLGQARRAAA